MVIYLVEHGLSVYKEHDRLEIYKGGELVRTYPSNQVEAIVIMSNVTLSNYVISYALKHDIDVVFLSSRGIYRGRLIGHVHKNAELRLKQFKRYEDESFSLFTARAIVQAKAKNSKFLLQRYNWEKKNYTVKDFINKINSLIARIDFANDIAVIRGLEGKISALYFSAMSNLFIHKDFKFTNRNRRPPLDPINALLSFLYTLILQRVESSVYECGLDPYFGFFHTIDYSKPSLVLDLMEEFRPVVDGLALRLVNKSILKTEDFWYKEEFLEDEKDAPSVTAVYLNIEGNKKVISYFQRWLQDRKYVSTLGNTITINQIIKEQCKILSKSINDNEIYTPFIIK